MLSRRWLLATFVLAPCLLTALANSRPANAQDDAVVRDRVVSAAVQIAILVDVTSEGIRTPHALPVGSGSIVSPDGLILTNWHVTDMTAHRARLTQLEQQAQAASDALTFTLEDQGVLILTSDGSSPPQRAYLAEPVAHDAQLDLAVLQIVASFTGAGISQTVPRVPFVPLGDVAGLSLGDPIHIYGYPAAGGDALTYTRGVVSGFNFDAGHNSPAWITTDATLSGGSSGGTAVDATGALIGVPTQGSALDCLSVDTITHDGQLDGREPGCVPIGGSLGQLRPITLALPLLETAGLDLDASQQQMDLPKADFPVSKGNAIRPPGTPSR